DVPDADPVFPQQGHAVGVAGISAPVGGRARVEDQGVSMPFLVWRMRMAENEQMEGFPREGGDGPVEGGALPPFAVNQSDPVSCKPDSPPLAEPPANLRRIDRKSVV